MVEVFKTNVEKISQTKTLIAMIRRHFPGSDVSFDLEDCDNVLRVEGRYLERKKVIAVVRECGFICELLK